MSAPGHVRSHTVDGWIADVRLLSDDEGAVTISLEPPAEPGSFRPTCPMERLSEAIEAEPGIGRRISDAPSGGRTTLRTSRFGC